MPARSRYQKTRSALLSLTLVSASVVGAWKGQEYAGDPVGEKDCPPLVTEAATAPARVLATTVTATPALSLAPNRNETGAVLPWTQRGGTINDASCLDQTAVYGIVRVTSLEEIGQALAFAREHGLRVSIAGVRHSMGGQAFARDALVLDMTGFNQLSLDRDRKILTVESGATWHQIQAALHPTYAVKAMQSTDIFTVGGSIAVNAHGMDHRAGSVGRTVRSLRLMRPDGTIVRLSRTENRELFDLVVGGYGLFGVVLDVELEVTDNVLYTPGRRLVNYREFPELFARDLDPNAQLGLFYGHLSTAPGSLLQEMILYTYTETADLAATIPPLGEVSQTKLRRLVINLAKRGAFWQRLKWWSEKAVEPRLEGCSISRSQAQRDGEACLVSRNEPMHDSVRYLKNRLPDDTDILQEYFIPRNQFVSFIDGLRPILTAEQTTLLNASIRVVHPEDNTLTYAPTEMFAVVLYINQGTAARDNERMASLTRQIVDLTLRHQGTFFLPYQLYYTPEQLRQAYPASAAFFAAKRRYDPEGLFTSTFYERYASTFATGDAALPRR